MKMKYKLIIISFIILACHFTYNLFFLYNCYKSVSFFSDTNEYELAKYVSTQRINKIKKICSENPAIIEKSYDEKYYSVLHYAAEEGKIKSVQALLESGMNPDVADLSNETPLFSILDYLDEISYKKDYSKIVEMLLSYGANANITKRGSIDYDGLTYSGCTPLMKSVCCHNMNYLKILIEKGNAIINTKTDYGVTATIVALWMGNIKSAHYLIVECKADIRDPFTCCMATENYSNTKIYPVMLLDLFQYDEGTQEYFLLQEIKNEFLRQGIDINNVMITDEIRQVFINYYPFYVLKALR